MAYIEKLNCFIGFWEKATKMKCSKCGATFGDNRGISPNAKLFEFDNVNTTIHCPNCDNTVYHVTTGMEPYIEDSILDMRQADMVESNGVEDDEED